MTALPDEQVVAGVLAGNPALFEVLMRRHNQRVYRAVRVFLHDESEVEDAMQQAYLRAYTHLGQLTEGTKVASWLVRVAVNEALSRLRQRRRRSETDLDVADEEGEVMSALASPETAAGDREMAALLESALGELREIYRVVFVLREVEGMSTDEVAEALDVSPQVVKTRLSRAKELLRQRLLDRGGKAVTEVFPFHAPRCDRVVAAVLDKIRSLGSTS